MSEVIYIVVPIALVVIILKVCLICWRVWAYQQRRQRLMTTQHRTRVARVHAPAVARVVRVERCITNDGSFAQRTSYAINQPGQAPRQFQRTILIRPADNRRPNDPNLPPSYDMAITGKDQSVKIENGPSEAAPPPMAQATPTSNPLASPPVYSSVPRAPATLPTAHEEDIPSNDRTRLLFESGLQD